MPPAVLCDSAIVPVDTISASSCSLPSCEDGYTVTLIPPFVFLAIASESICAWMPAALVGGFMWP